MLQWFSTLKRDEERERGRVEIRLTTVHLNPSLAGKVDQFSCLLNSRVSLHYQGKIRPPMHILG